MAERQIPCYFPPRECVYDPVVFLVRLSIAETANRVYQNSADS